ncbi:hypothetical protein [Microcoleus sp. F4-D5]|uniref:hypothetical protein n=1 Tax=Microcoleus sp. F4-D5 TaxID=2818760 RepID=UPI002FD2E41C
MDFKLIFSYLIKQRQILTFYVVNKKTLFYSVETQPKFSEHGKEFAKYFQEYNGKYSTMRAMSFTVLIAAIVFGAITITSNNSEGKYITTAFFVAAFAPKAVQRFAERA